ncbi:hypothetical protein NLI96_g9014 [Meripilus lineatus]|uniref:Uncharacterized protein n=1 Tax=Meripilus lineatus TaxID=2056292 RepID=A0AAD5YFN5_9APHY|nr:hypothetical protein NLI96_g9014 [Physisporinus lineatus]
MSQGKYNNPDEETKRGSKRWRSRERGVGVTYLGFITAELSVTVGKTLQSDRELDVTRITDVLNLEFRKLGVKAKLLDDASRRQSKLTVATMFCNVGTISGDMLKRPGSVGWQGFEGMDVLLRGGSSSMHHASSSVPPRLHSYPLSVDTLSISTIPVPHFPSSGSCPTSSISTPAALAPARMTSAHINPAFSNFLSSSCASLKDPLVSQGVIFPKMSGPLGDGLPFCPSPFRVSDLTHPLPLSLFVTLCCLLFPPAGRTLSNDFLPVPSRTTSTPEWANLRHSDLQV